MSVEARAAATSQLAEEAADWRIAEGAYRDALETRRRNVLRAVNDDKLPVQLVAELFGVSRQYISKLIAG